MPQQQQQQQQQQQPVIRRRSVPSRRRRDGLIRWASDTTSQNGEDGIVARLFALLPPRSGSSEPRRWCVDVGAWDGVHLSNTHSLLFGGGGSSEKWRGILIEADPQKFIQLSKLHADPAARQNICLNVSISGTSSDAPNSLHRILSEDYNCSDLPKSFDFLCIDIDGSDYWVLHDLWKASEFRPVVVCIEFNPTMPDDLIYIPPRDDSLRHGASLSALVELATENDYVLVETTLYNAFFVVKDQYEQYLVQEVPDTSIEALHQSTMGTSIYQLYDGTLKLWGCKKMLWHRLPMNESKLQMLPENQRSFPFAPCTGNNSETPFDASPAIDLGPYTNHHEHQNIEDKNSSRKKCAADLLAQLQKDGFCLVRGTGMDREVCQRALGVANAFLQDANESVRRSCLARSDRALRGYSPMNMENFASLVGEHGPNDLVRKFRMGPIQPSTVVHNNDDSIGATNSTLLQPNVWPSSEIWDDGALFQSAIEEYYEAICNAAHNVVRAICDGLLLAHPDLESALQPLTQNMTKNGCFDQTSSILTLLGYCTGTRHKGKYKGPLVAAHTDVGVITVILFDGGIKTCASLQRKYRGGWIDVELPQSVPVDPVFVVNVADCLSDLSQGRIPSTLHRVVARRESANPRNCCALFVGLDPGAQLMIGGESISYEEWRKRRIARAQKFLKQQLLKESTPSESLSPR